MILQSRKKMKKWLKKAVEFCKKTVKALDLRMKVLLAEYTFDGTKLTIYFASERKS